MNIAACRDVLKTSLYCCFDVIQTCKFVSMTSPVQTQQIQAITGYPQLNQIAAIAWLALSSDMSSVGLASWARNIARESTLDFVALEAIIGAGMDSVTTGFCACHCAHARMLVTLPVIDRRNTDYFCVKFLTSQISMPSLSIQMIYRF